MFSLTKKSPHVHKFFVDALTNDEVCLCGKEKWKRDKTNKFNAKSTSYEGVVYHSAFEAGYARELDLRQRAGEIVRWERQVRIRMAVCLECSKLVWSECANHLKAKPLYLTNYYIDFLVHYPDGTKEFVETKGVEGDAWKIKWKMLEAILSNKEEYKMTLVKERSQRNWKLKK